MRKFLIILITVLGFASISAASNTVIVSGHYSRAPFDWQEGDKIVGAAIEILQRVFAELDLEVDARYVGPWKRTLYSLEKGSIDVMCGLYITEERKKFAVFTEPYIEDQASVFVWKGREFKFETWDDLKGKVFGELLGASRGKKFDDWRKKYATVEYVNEHELNFKKLERKRIDCFVMSRYHGLLAIKKFGYEGKIVPLEHPVFTKNIQYAMYKKSQYVKYLPQINEHIKKLREDGTIEKIIQKNLDYYLSTQ